jgi:hypothetical protein
MIMRRHGAPIGNKGKPVAAAPPAAKPTVAAAVAKRERKGRGPEKKD